MMNASSAALVVLLNLHDKLVEKRQRTVDLFRKIDESGDGVVDPEEFRAGLDAFGFTTSDEDFKSLMEVLDKEYVTSGGFRCYAAKVFSIPHSYSYHF